MRGEGQRVDWLKAVGPSSAGTGLLWVFEGAGVFLHDFVGEGAPEGLALCAGGERVLDVGHFELAAAAGGEEDGGDDSAGEDEDDAEVDGGGDAGRFRGGCEDCGGFVA